MVKVLLLLTLHTAALLAFNAFGAEGEENTGDVQQVVDDNHINVSFARGNCKYHSDKSILICRTISSRFEKLCGVRIFEPLYIPFDMSDCNFIGETRTYSCLMAEQYVNRICEDLKIKDSV